MRIFLPSLFILVHLVCISLPTAASDSSIADTSIQVENLGVAEGSGDTVNVTAWASFLSPTRIVESVKNATESFFMPKPSQSDFWEMVKEYEKVLQDHVPRMLEDAAVFFESISFTNITFTMQHMVNTTATFRNNIEHALDARPVSFDTFVEELEVAFMEVVSDLEKIPPPDKALGHPERAKLVNKVLDDTTLALTSLAAQYGVEEEMVTTYILAMRPCVQTLTVTIGDINEQYPQLFPILAFSVSILLIPESWILRPFLRMFGFGPAGPVKGLAAPWMQRLLWGAAVKPGSWFSMLQAAGMGVYPKWAGLVAKVPLFLGGLSALLPSFKSE